MMVLEWMGMISMVKKMFDWIKRVFLSKQTLGRTPRINNCNNTIINNNYYISMSTTNNDEK